MNRTLTLVLVILALALQATACSMIGCSSDIMAMRTNFQVVITHNGKPVIDAEVEISRFGSDDEDASDVSSHKFSIATDDNGVASIEHLKPGLYNLSATYLGIGAGSDCFRVLEDAKAKTESPRSGATCR